MLIMPVNESLTSANNGEVMLYMKP